MNRSDLVSQLSQLGFPLMEAEPQVDIKQVLSEVIRSRDLRLWEGFPILLANAGETGDFDYWEVEKSLKSRQEKDSLRGCLLLSLAVYDYFQLNFYWAKLLYDRLPKNQKKRVQSCLSRLRHKTNIRLSGYLLSSDRVASVFQNYFVNSAVKTRNELAHSEELSLHYALSQIFSPKQKELFLKKLRGEKMTKTEREYFSRTVKKKALSLANPELHRLAQIVSSS
jgi:hypothetical protein